MPARRPLIRGAIALQGFALDSRRWTASLDGMPLTLTPTEFLLLFALLVHPGWVLSRAELGDLLASNGDMVSERAIDSHVKNLRRKCRMIRPGTAVIQTVYGVGYKISGPPSQHP